MWAYFQNALFASGTGDQWHPLTMMLETANHSTGALGSE